MAVKVSVPSNRSTNTTVSSITPATRVSTIITRQSAVQTATELGGLTGVDTTGVQDGYTLIYDSETGNWEASPAGELSGSITNLDGGTF